MEAVTQWWMWLIFLSIVAVMLFVDLFVFAGGRAHKVSTKESLTWFIVWIIVALLFNLGFWWYLQQTTSINIANQKAIEFFTGYLIEKSLSVENMFVFLTIFSYFAIPQEYQRRVLIYGVLGAIIMRLIMIYLGLILINKFAWILYIFGVFLIFTGIKMLIFANQKNDLSNNPLLRWLQGHLRITKELHQEKFFITKNNLLYVTPLFIVLIFIELSDLVFAVDSIPAIFAITNDPFIVATSNIFAILGLRSMYFLMADMAERFHLLKYGLAVVLMFVGTKMLIAPWFKISAFQALAVIASIILISIIASLWLTKKNSEQ